MDYPLKGFKLREISRKINLGLPSVSNYVKELEKEGLIIKKDIHGNFLWFSEREKDLFKKYKIADKIISIEKSGLLVFLDEMYEFPNIILFGSSVLGEDFERSDLDLCIISEVKKEINTSKYENKLKKPIQLFIFNKKIFKSLELSNPELFNNIINGIVLRGALKIR